MKEVWMVEWSDDYCDWNAAFSTREKAVAYIEQVAKCRKLDKLDFKLTIEDNRKGDPEWGFYEMKYGNVTYQKYIIDIE